MKTFVASIIIALSILLLGCSQERVVEVLQEERVATYLQKRGELSYEVNEDKPFTGKYVVYWDSGRKRSAGNYKSGKKDGLWTTWHQNGQKWSEGNYKDRKEGLWTWWWENGQKASLENLKNGAKHGLATFWKTDGQKIKEANYKNGKMIEKLCC